MGSNHTALIDRRCVFDDPEAYLKIMDDYNANVENILRYTSQKICDTFEVTQEEFDYSVKVMYDDPDISYGIQGLAVIEPQ